MKKLFVYVLAAALTAAAAAAENPYADYGKAMASAADSPMAVEWQAKNAAAIAAATTPEALAAHVKDAAAARALLAQVKGAYTSCPLALTTIAAVSQRVMVKEDGCPFLNALAFWRHSRADERKVWVRALIDTAKASNDEYVKMFMLDQLRWCACAKAADAVREIGAGGSKAVKDFADWTAREIAK